MWLEYLDPDGRPHRVRATRLVVKDERYENEHAIAIDAEGCIVACDASREMEFNSLLHTMGIHKTILVTEIVQKPVRDIRFET